LIEAAGTASPSAYAQLSQVVLGRWIDAGEDLGRLLYYVSILAAAATKDLASELEVSFSDALQRIRLNLMESSDGL
jgi:hypothetical protein